MGLSAQQIAEKWARNLGQSSESIKAGVNAVTVSPTERAAAREDAYIQGVQAAVASGKWKRGLQRVTVGDWRSAMLNKGVPRIGPGATQAIPKMQKFMSEFLPWLEEGQKKLSNMPRGSLQDNINRMIAQVEHNAAFQRTG